MKYKHLLMFAPYNIAATQLYAAVPPGTSNCGLQPQLVIRGGSNPDGGLGGMAR